MSKNYFALWAVTLLGAIAMSDAITDAKTAKATFAGGCFWCMQPPYDKLPGVLSVKVGYTGGHTKHPTYEDVCTGTTGRAQAVEIIYDPAKVSYDQLLDVYD